MRLFRWALVAGLVIVFGVAIQQSLLWLGVGGNLNESQVKTLEDGDQEIAFIEPATSTDDWGRLITAAQLLEHNWTKVNPSLARLKVSLDGAFPPLTAAVPELAFAFEGTKSKLRLRWYKISGEHDAASWVQKLHDRKPQPLAVIGGATSDRAIKLAYALRNSYDGREPPVEPNVNAPVYIITTATAEETRSKKPVMSVYKSRTFRFSFTNQTMVESLLQFANRRQITPDHDWARNLWVHKGAEAETLNAAIAGTIVTPRLQPYSMYTFSWLDERYSLDMADSFQRNFRNRYPLGEFHPAAPITSGIGGFNQPAPEEQITVDTFLAHPSKPHSFLALPTQTVRMRRFLINLRQRSEQTARNLVVLNGDAISFHTIYRDRDVMWNILDLPYSLVFFSHRNPVDASAGFREEKELGNHKNGAFPPPSTSGTHDLLLYQDIFEALLYAIHDGSNLWRDPQAIRTRLRSTCWRQADGKALRQPRVGNALVHKDKSRLLFDADGDRQRHTGEHVVWLKPNFTGDIVDLRSKLSVWTIDADENSRLWHLVDDIDVSYNQAGLGGGS